MKRAICFPHLSRRCPPKKRGCLNPPIARLKSEHVSLDAMWHRVQAKLEEVEAGQANSLTEASAHNLGAAYEQHIRFEESDLLPFARRLLTPDALGANRRLDGRRDAASNLRNIDRNRFLSVWRLTFLAPKSLGFFQRGKMPVDLRKIRQRACREPALGEMNKPLRRSKRFDETLRAGSIVGLPQHVLYCGKRLQVRAGAALAEQGGEEVNRIAQALGIDAHLMAAHQDREWQAPRNRAAVGGGGA